MKGKLLRIFNEKTRLLELVSQQGGFILALIEINLKSYKYITLPSPAVFQTGTSVSEAFYIPGQPLLHLNLLYLSGRLELH